MRTVKWASRVEPGSSTSMRNKIGSFRPWDLCPPFACKLGGVNVFAFLGHSKARLYDILGLAAYSFLLSAAIQTVGEGARLAGGRSGETRGIGRRNGGVLRRVAAVS